MKADLLVLGGGPAGAEAAVAGARCGLSVVLLDSAPAAGGQVYRAASSELETSGHSDVEHDAGDQLRARLAETSVHTEWEQTVWFVEPGFAVDAVGPTGRRTFQADALIVASGTYERIIPVPGWTLPGVFGLGAVTLLLKSQRILPGARTIVAGCGPLLLAAAAGILEAGGEVAAIVDLNGWSDVARVAPRLASRPDLVKRGMQWATQLRRHRVPIFRRHAVVSIDGDSSVTGAVIAPVDRRWRPMPGPRRQLVADAVALGHGLVPSVEITRLLEAEHVFVPLAGGWVPQRDTYGRTTVPGLYVAGDVCGIAGAAAAHERGQLAGLAAAFDLTKIDEPTFNAETTRRGRAVRQAERFGSAAAQLMRVRDGLMETITDDTIVCRCEDVTRRELETAIAEGGTTLNAIKAMTRCGMGPCQGRMCGEAAASLLADRVGGRLAAGAWTARPPLRPVPFDALTGDFVYADIPLQPRPS